VTDDALCMKNTSSCRCKVKNESNAGLGVVFRVSLPIRLPSYQVTSNSVGNSIGNSYQALGSLPNSAASLM
jgi:hypothetical protein